jgi:anthranilate synthase component 1
MMADLLTPVGIYLKIRDLYPQSALLESSDFHGSEGALSFIAMQPMGSFAVNRGLATATMPDGSVEETSVSADHTVSDLLDAFIHRFSVGGEHADRVGMMGYSSFNVVQYLDRIPVRESRCAENDAPDMLYILYKYLLIFDHFRNELTLVELLKEGEASRLDSLVQTLGDRNVATYGFHTVGEPFSTITDEEYREFVRQGIAHCHRGDVFQIVLSRRFIQRYTGDDFTVYRTLRSVNPSPYLFYFDFGGFRIFGSSPETHCKIVGGRVSIDPIAGTTRRTGDEQKDRALCKALLEDPKENAEHVMLVDLARNDVSRNAYDVCVDFYKEPQYYSHVIHLVSRVVGRLRPDRSATKAFFDTFPAGTLSGAPKIRAMQLIAEIEPHNRGAYGGCIGFVGLNGDINQAITIRSFVSRNGELWYQAGAGIVAKSVPENELQEVNNKLGALRQAIRLAEEQA